jgi:UDP-N-acetylmuramoyl-tripeptide--D-alanyl-D-alanine ligase
MIPLRLGDIGMATLVRGDAECVITSVVADSRLAGPGALFVCLRGSRRDGHDYALDAVSRGALAALCARGSGRGILAPGVALLEADDPLDALGGIARLVRRRSHAHIVGVAGSVGKTSTKDVLRALLAPHMPTVASPASYNNELGVPLTLSLLEPGTAVCVCELGTGAPGELSGLCTIAEPTLGVITAVGPEHLEFFGTLEAVAAEESGLIATLPRGASLVVPQQAPLLDSYRRGDLDEWRFGLEPLADVRPLAWRTSLKTTEVVLAVRGERVAFPTNLRLPHHRLTLAAAVAACAALGVPFDRIGDGAAAVELSPCRGQEYPLAGGGVLINDAYNANPLSIAAALEAVTARRDGGRAVAVLGDMAELGPNAADWHSRAGRYAATLGVDVLVAVGPEARAYLTGNAGRMRCYWFPDATAARRALPPLLQPGDTVLLKGSRSARLELVAEALTPYESRQEPGLQRRRRSGAFGQDCPQLAAAEGA